VLKNLEKYIVHFREAENIYYLSKAGRELVGCEKVVKKNPNFMHTLMRNDIYVYFNCPKHWRNEFVIPTEEFKIVADAIFRVEKTDYFLEVDYTQKMKRNIEKINQYARFKEMNLWHGVFPTLVFYTAKDSRQIQLRDYCKQKELECKIYTKEDLE
jgi:hypothetical protein